MMDLDLSGKHALVCGASQGIGRAVALELAGMGASVTVLARRAEKLKALIDEMPAATGPLPHYYVTLDGSDLDALRKAMQDLVKRAPVHILINNSGGPPPGPVLSAEITEFEAALRSHLFANQVRAQELIPGMRETGYGRIVNIISTSVKEPIPGIGVSNVTRGAVANWAKTLAGEVAAEGITVNNVLPGSTHTPRIEQIIASRASTGDKNEDAVRAAMTASIPLGRFAEPEETAAAVAFLASPAAAAITGINLPVDGGRTRSL